MYVYDEYDQRIIEERVAQKKLTRAEVCLLLASAMRPEKERYSALQRAAIRVASGIEIPLRERPSGRGQADA